MSFLPKKTIVVPIDFSLCSAPAIRTALELVETPASVHVIHVIQPLNPVSPLGIWDDANAQQTLLDNAKNYLEKFLVANEIEGVTSSVEVGPEGTRIVEYADQHQADLVVIPSHGHSGLQRALLGSVAERVIRHVNCPTLVLRREEEDGECLETPPSE